MLRQEIMELGSQKRPQITTEQILSIHHVLISIYGGVVDLRSEENIDDINKLVDKVNSCPKRSDIISCATDVIYNIIRRSPFITANKRTAYLTAGVILYLYGFSIQAEPDEIMELLANLGNGRVSREETDEWIRIHITSETITAI